MVHPKNKGRSVKRETVLRKSPEGQRSPGKEENCPS